VLCCRHFFFARHFPEANVVHKPHHPHHARAHPSLGSPTRRDFLSALICAAVVTPWAMGQQETQSPSEIAERFRKISEDYEKEGLAKDTPT
jgi:hypothetical protein